MAGYFENADTKFWIDICTVGPECGQVEVFESTLNSTLGLGGFSFRRLEILTEMMGVGHGAYPSLAKRNEGLLLWVHRM